MRVSFQSLSFLSKAPRYRKVKKQAHRARFVGVWGKNVAEVVKLVDTLP